MADDQPSVPRRSVLGVDLRDAFAMAEYLLEVHGLDDWEVSYDNAKRRAGICHFAEQTVGLSAPLTAVHTEDDVRDTILHEIAHALVGPAHGTTRRGGRWPGGSAARGSGAPRRTRRPPRPRGSASVPVVTRWTATGDRSGC